MANRPPDMAGTPGADLSAAILDEALIEELWQDLRGQVTREEIRQTAARVAVEFENATVTAYLRIFIRRRTLEQLAVRPHPGP